MILYETTISPVFLKEKSLEIFTSDNGLDPFLLRIRKEIDSFFVDVSMDMSFTANRKSVSSMAHKIARSKTMLDEAGKELTTKLKEMPKKVDAERKRMRELLDDWKEEVREPLTKWELAEEVRVNEIKSRIDSLDYSNSTILSNVNEIEAHLDILKNINIDDSFCEFKEKAESRKNKSILFLQEQLEKRILFEAEEAERNRIEKERLAEEERKAEDVRLEREKRICEEAKRLAEKEADILANRAKQEYERRELELKYSAEKAKREALEAKEKSKRIEEETEKRIKLEADEKARKEQEELKKREEDRENRLKITKSIIDDFISIGFDLETSKKICSHIQSGDIAHVKVVY